MGGGLCGDCIPCLLQTAEMRDALREVLTQVLSQRFKSYIYTGINSFRHPCGFMPNLSWQFSSPASSYICSLRFGICSQFQLPWGSDSTSLDPLVFLGFVHNTLNLITWLTNFLVLHCIVNHKLIRLGWYSTLLSPHPPPLKSLIKLSILWKCSH